MVITLAKLRMGHASTHGARKLPGPKTNITKKNLFFFLFLLVMTKYGGNKISALGVSPKLVKSRRHRKRKKKKTTVSENNGQLRIHGSCLDQKPLK